MAARRGPSLVVAAAGLLLAAALAAAFALWNAGGAWSFPWFVACAGALVYAPGRLLLRALRLQAPPLDSACLAVAAGMAAACAAYWACAHLQARGLFWAYPALALLATAHPRLRPRPAWPGQPRHAHALLLGVVALALLPFAASPLYYQNLARQPGGTLSFYPLPDVLLHVSVASELTHTIPPQYPYLPGRPLAYHYGMDLLAAAFAGCGLTVQDLTLRYLPTLFLSLAVVGAFCLARKWCAEPMACVVALLVVLGDDLSFVPGLLLGSTSVWAVHFLGVPSVVSLFLVNPMLPALGLLFAVLLALDRLFAARRAGWLALTALLTATLAGFKVFTALQLMAGLGVAGVVFAVRQRRFEALAAAAAAGVALLPLLLWVSGSSSRFSVALEPWPYVPGALVRSGLAETRLGQLALAFYAGDRSLSGGLVFLLLALPAYLALALGARLLGLPAWARALRHPAQAGPLVFLMAFATLVGPPLSLLLTMAPLGYPKQQMYNDAVWFFVQSKYLLWLFAAFPLGRLSRRAALVAAPLVLAAALPSSLQYLGVQARDRQPPLDRATLEMLEFLERDARPGETCLAREETAHAILATTRCRAPALGVFAHAALSVQEYALLRARRAGFWEAWRRGSADDALLGALGADHVVADLAQDGTPAASALERRFANARFAVFRVRPRRLPAP